MGKKRRDYQPARFFNEWLQLCLHLIVSEEGLVGRVGHRKGIPVLEQCAPGLEETSKDVELKYRDVIVDSEVNGGLESNCLERGVNWVSLLQCLLEQRPGDDCSVSVFVCVIETGSTR